MSNRSKFAAVIAEKLDVTKVKADEILVAVTSALVDHIKAEGEAVFPGLGRLKTSVRAPRRGHNPKTGQEIDIPAKRVLKFKAFPGGLD